MCFSHRNFKKFELDISVVWPVSIIHRTALVEELENPCG